LPLGATWLASVPEVLFAAVLPVLLPVFVLLLVLFALVLLVLLSGTVLLSVEFVLPPLWLFVRLSPV
jgi:hypothetical protein